MDANQKQIEKIEKKIKEIIDHNRSIYDQGQKIIKDYEEFNKMIQRHGEETERQYEIMERQWFRMKIICCTSFVVPLLNMYLRFF